MPDTLIYERDINIVDMQCVRPHTPNDERWIALNKDTFQQIFNATLDKMTAAAITGEEGAEDEDVVSQRCPVEPASARRRRSQSPSLPSGYRYPAADMPQLSASVHHAPGEPLDLSKKTINVDIPTRDHNAPTNNAMAAKDERSSTTHCGVPSDNQWSKSGRSNSYSTSSTRRLSPGSTHATAVGTQSERLTGSRSSQESPSTSSYHSDFPTRRNSAPPPTHRLTPGGKSSWLPCSRKSVDKLIEKVVHNMEDKDDQQAPTLRDHLTGNVPRSFGVESLRSKPITSKLTIDTSSEPYSSHSSMHVASGSPVSNLNDDSSQDGGRSSSSPCWVALSKMYVYDIVDSAMNPEHSDRKPSHLSSRSSESSQGRSTDLSDRRDEDSAALSARLLREALQGKPLSEVKSNTPTRDITTHIQKTTRKSPPKRRGETPFSTGAQCKRRKNSIAKKVSATVWEPPRTGSPFLEDDQDKISGVSASDDLKSCAVKRNTTAACHTSTDLYSMTSQPASTAQRNAAAAEAIKQQSGSMSADQNAPDDLGLRHSSRRCTSIASNHSSVSSNSSDSGSIPEASALPGPKAGWVVISKKDVHTIIDTVVGSMICDTVALSCDIKIKQEAADNAPPDENIESYIEDSERDTTENNNIAETKVKVEKVDGVIYTNGDNGSVSQLINSLESMPSLPVPDVQSPTGSTMTSRSSSPALPMDRVQPSTTSDSYPRSCSPGENLDTNTGDVSRAFKWKSSLLLRVNEQTEPELGARNGTSGSTKRTQHHTPK